MVSLDPALHILLQVRVNFFFNSRFQTIRKCISSLLRFLDASSHLYMRVCPSVGRSVGPSVGDAFVKNGKIDDFNSFLLERDRPTDRRTDRPTDGQTLI